MWFRKEISTIEDKIAALVSQLTDEGKIVWENDPAAYYKSEYKSEYKGIKFKIKYDRDYTKGDYFLVINDSEDINQIYGIDRIVEDVIVKRRNREKDIKNEKSKHFYEPILKTLQGE